MFQWQGHAAPSHGPDQFTPFFGYTLVANELAAFLETAGLDSYLGCLHQIDYGRRSLALDLIEPLRAPLVDRMVLTMLKRKQFAAEDFEQGKPGGVYLRADSAKRFFAEYERWMLHGPAEGEEGFRAALRDSVHSYAAAVRDSDPSAYSPYLFKNERRSIAGGDS